MERVNWEQMHCKPKNNTEDMVSWLIIEAMMKKTKELGFPEMNIEEVWPFEKTDDSALEVILTINGIEVSFMGMIERIVESFDEEVSLKAKELIAEKFYEAKDLLDDLETQINCQLYDDCQKSNAPQLRNSEEE